jgi:hypothetical protein
MRILSLTASPLEGVNFSFDDNPLIVLGRGVMEGGPGVPSDALPRG